MARLPKSGAIVAYNASFERRCIKQLAELYPDLAPSLLAADARVVDLLPVARACWYHPEQRGSWSIKAVLPSLVSNLSYATLDVGDGSAAQSAYLEAIATHTSAERRAEIASALRTYCALDTEGLVHVLHRLVDGPINSSLPAGTV